MFASFFSKRKRVVHSRVLESTLTVRPCFSVPLLCFVFYCFVPFRTLTLQQATVSMVVPSSSCMLPRDLLLLSASSRFGLHVEARKEYKAGCSCLAFASVSPRCCVSGLTRGLCCGKVTFCPPTLQTPIFYQRDFDFNLSRNRYLHGRQHPSTSHCSSQ